MRNNTTTAPRSTTPSQYQVKEITSRGLPVPSTYDAAQALIDSFPPSDAQKRRMDEVGLSAETRGEAKQVIADFVAANPEIGQRWDAENAEARVTRRQDQRGEQDPKVTTKAMFQLLADHGVQNIPSDFATAARMIDDLPPSEGMVQVLKEHGRAVPETRGAANEVIRGLPATPDQIVSIMRQTAGRYAPRTRGEAERWFSNNRRTRANDQEAAAAAA
ncbi:hypothetical protein [Longimicrobium terrae]|uniref:Uncharacterized protein n=1 Tax=Longimicrobium terrae TaxID=1639882 RepID=A0A841GSL6_9BACT|nr:hypothetical protein [Longimicrobium terrae]MBB4635884.1 hypothetical protein [Longimicrobium terrae]MBB6070280.1 hypothetical protein [Longimicrobium terrae]NNC30784.1 hypothetical protein [Longimicrobium terrae]